MTRAPEPALKIYLWAIEATEPGPLRRWLGHKAWRMDPVVSLRYEPDGDRIMFRLVDMPSTASGLDGRQPIDPTVGMFIGFDGTSSDSWPTTIALQDFGRHLRQETDQLSVLREIVGRTALAAAAELRGTPGGDREARISPDETDRLIRRWGQLVIDGEKALDAELAELCGTATVREPAALVEAWPVLSAAAISREPGDLSQSGGFERRSDKGGPHAGSGGGTREATGAGAAMARTSSSGAQDRQTGDLPYGLLAKLADIMSAWRDGRASAPPLPEPGQPYDPADPRVGMTPYLEIRNRHFSERAEREQERTLIELAQAYQRRAVIQEEITDAEENAKELHKHLEGMPTAPTEPHRANALELQLGVSEELFRTRRQREFLGERRRIATLEGEALKIASQLRKEESRLGEEIVTRERIRDARVLQLLQHSRRRCGTYMRHIVHHHPDGSAVIQYLELRLPTPPEWLKQPPPAAGPQPPSP